MKAERPAVQLCWRVVGHELPALLREPVDVRRAISHHALMVGAEVPDADVIAHDDQDVRLLDRISLLGRRWIPRRARGQQDRPPGACIVAGIHDRKLSGRGARASPRRPSGPASCPSRPAILSGPPGRLRWQCTVAARSFIMMSAPAWSNETGTMKRRMDAATVVDLV